MSNKEKDIAVIGIALRFPGADSIEEFWSNLINKKESVTFFTDDELISMGVDKAVLENKNYVKASPIIKDIDKFDAHFFGYSPREAEMIDPQVRLFLESSWEALESSGYCAEKYEGQIGVYGGAYVPHYLIKNLVHLVHDSMRREDELYTLYQCMSDFLTTNVAYKLNLRGPSLNVQSWCTTALSAIHVACQALRNGECDMALAGAVNIKIPQEGYFYEPNSTVSPDGHSRSFDADGEGTVPGNGLGVLVLKPLGEAIRDRDTIHAVIKGAAITNDGSMKQKLSYHAITIDGQVRAITKAISEAGVDYEAIKYMELYGGATSLSDRSELNAIKKAFRSGTGKKSFCAVGSVIPNIGHLGSASGMASIIKTILTLKNRVIPATINYSKPNVHSNLDDSPFFINKESLRLAEDGRPAVACVNSYGMGGTNFHVILEEPPKLARLGEPGGMHLITLSAKTGPALARMSENLANFIASNPSVDLADMAYTLNTGRKDFNYRRYLLGETPKELTNALLSKEISTLPISSTPTGIYMLLSGSSGVTPQVVAEFVRREPLFERHYGEMLLRFDPPGENGQDSHTLSLCFEYALGRMLMERGVNITGMVGIGMGELVAACLSGALPLGDLVLTGNGEQFRISPPPHPALPRIPYISGQTGDWFNPDQGAESTYWERLAGGSSKIDAVLDKLNGQELIIVDFGFLRGRERSTTNHTVLQLLDGNEKTASGIVGLHRVIGELWSGGNAINWNLYYNDLPRRKIPLPTYPFERKRYWVDPPRQPLLGGNSVGGSDEIGDSKYSREDLTSIFAAPMNEVEKSLTVMWETLFGIDGIGRDDDFQELGGNSLHATMLLNKINSSYKVNNISLRDIFDNPTIAMVAALIEGRKGKNGKNSTIDVDEFKRLPTDLQIRTVADYLMVKISGYTHYSLESIDAESDLKGYNITSYLTELIWDIKMDFKVLLYPHEIQNLSNIQALSQLIADELFRMGEKSNKKSISISDFSYYDWVPEVLPEKQSGDRNGRAVFILSAGRTGSTILRVMLAGHSHLFCPPELGLLLFNSMREWDGLYQKISNIAKDGLAYALMDIFNCDYAAAKELVGEYVRKDLPTKEVYRIMQKQSPGRILVDKTPDYSHVKDVLRKAETVFESAQYIYLTRHPYAVVDSYVRNRFDKSMELKEEYNPFMLGENMWTTANLNILEFLENVEKKRCFTIRYEELVKSPERVMTGVCKFLGVPFEAAMVNPYDGNRRRMIAGPGDPNVFVHSSINPDLADVWRDIRLPHQFARATLDVAARLGYELPNDTIQQNKSEDRIEKIERRKALDLNDLSMNEIDSLINKLLIKD